MKGVSLKKIAVQNNISDLRERARRFLAAEPEMAEMSQVDIQNLVHELNTYQIELELQNEDLRNTQEELERSRVRYADLYEFSPVAYFTINDKGLIVKANLTAGSLLEVARGQLAKQRFADFITREDQDIFYLHRKKLLETGQQQSFELRLQRKGGSFFYAQVELTLLPDGCEQRGEMHIAVTNVTIRKEADLAKLLQMKNRYRAIVMDQTELICRFDLKGRMTFVNDSYCRYFGVDFKDILGTRFLPTIHPDDLPLVRNHYQALIPDSPEKTIELRVYLPDGKMHWQQWSGRAIHDRQGKLIEYQAVGRDITKLKEFEEKLRKESRLRQLFLDALPCIAMLLTYNTRIIIASNKAAAAVGAVPGIRCYEGWLQNDSPCPWCLAPKSSSENQPQNRQFWAHGKYWDAFWVPVDKEFYLHYLFDTTEKQQAKEALKKAHDELERRVKTRTLELQQSHAQLLHSEKLSAVGNLSASIAHEFNNPLQSVMTIIKGIGQYANLDQEEQELTALALQECNRMKNLISDLQDFFRPTSGKPGLVDLHGIIDALLLLCKKDMHIRRIAISRKYAAGLPHVPAVADQLKQVFLNLLNNAADACAGRSGRITITTSSVDEKNIVIHIKDNGEGINPADLDHIFEPFFTTKQEKKGTGLGLSVSYGIIKNHGGRIEVHSELGNGTTFSVFLPITSVINEQ